MGADDDVLDASHDLVEGGVVGAHADNVKTAAILLNLQHVGLLVLFVVAVDTVGGHGKCYVDVFER